jgi:hypothetical protein
MKFELLLALLAVCVFCNATPAALTPQNLRCEYRDAPLNVDVDQPRLSWTLVSDQRGENPTAYQLLVASTPALLTEDKGDLWDSGKTPMGDSIQIAYGGQKLTSGEACFWKVRAWGKDDQPSPWSDFAQWRMGLLAPTDWQGKWIAEAPGPTTRPMPLFRKDFTFAKPVLRATVYICGLGQFELHVNGSKIGKDMLQPGWTDYHKTCLYEAYDVSENIKAGNNVIAVMLGNGMYDVPAQRYHKFTGSFGPLMLMAQLRLDYADGTSESFATDSSWKTSPGPITFSSIYGGEDYDARLEQQEWDQVGFDDSAWASAIEVPAPGGQLFGVSSSAPLIRVAAVLDAKKVTQIKPEIWVYDLGQNCAMIPRLTVQGKAGTQVRLTPGELLNPDGSVNQSGSGKGAYYQYTLKDGPPRTWSPRFSYYGARYLQMEDASPESASVQGLFITSSSTPVGEFATSNDLFNRTSTLIQWAMRSNMMSILTDCPHREKLGWLEQDHLVGPSLMYNYDVAALLNKICCDMEDAQHDDGLVPDIAPEYVIFQNGFRDSPEWGSAAVLLPWNLYHWYGDLPALKNHYAMMKKYVAYLGSKANGGLLDYGLGDWYDLGPKRPGVAQLTPIGLTATAFYYYDLTILRQTAALLGDNQAAADYSRTAADVAKAFNDKYFDADKGAYATGSQTALAIPLVFGLVPQSQTARVLDALVKDIQSRNNGLTAGDVGYRYVLRALSDGGRSDVIYEMNRQSDRPGYGWQLDHGATSLTEAWNADPRSSQDHFMLGHIMEWFYSGLAGIGGEEDSVAFNHIRIQPALVGDITSAQASYQSIRGTISSAWRRDGAKITLEVSIPPGADATVYVPAKDAAKMREGDHPASDSAGVKFLRMENGAAVFAVESGQYNFVSQ